MLHWVHEPPKFRLCLVTMLLPRVPWCQCPMVSVSQIFATQIATDSPPLSPWLSHARSAEAGRCGDPACTGTVTFVFSAVAILWLGFMKNHRDPSKLWLRLNTVNLPNGMTFNKASPPRPLVTAHSEWGCGSCGGERRDSPCAVCQSVNLAAPGTSNTVWALSDLWSCSDVYFWDFSIKKF